MQPFNARTEPFRRRNVVILGSTGSIGRNTLDVIARFPHRFRVVGLTAGRNVELLLRQTRRFEPALVSVLNSEDAEWLRHRVFGTTRVLDGEAGFVEAACMEEAHVVVSAIVGAAGLKPTWEAVRSGKRIALANKETLVMAGELVMKEAEARGVSIFPVDSEHSAILQCLAGRDACGIRRILLTASGGPFRDSPMSTLRRIRPEDALAHPTWKMGPKISVDSSTLMNKGLEAIEARWLFGLPMEAIDIHIHPQSIVHSMVEFHDGSIVAHLSVPDMRIPIAYALSFPERLHLDLPRLDLFKIGQLTFEKPDRERFPCLDLAAEAGRAGGTMPTVLNAANEVAVALFLESRIAYVRIPELIHATMAEHDNQPIQELSDILKADTWARETAHRIAFGKS